MIKQVQKGLTLIELMGDVKTPVTEFYADKGTWPTTTELNSLYNYIRRKVCCYR